MKNLNLKPSVYIFLFISGIIWVCFALYSNIDLSKIWDFFLILPKVAAIDLILIAIFTKWGWKFKIFQGWLVPFPDLNGSWEGHIQTTWVNPETGKTPGPIPAILTIKQSFGSVSCVLRTVEMTSYSYAEEFMLEKDNQIRQLSYSYTSKPNLTVADRSTAHDGTIAFEIIGIPVSKLKGHYWTARKSTGEITLKFLCKKHLDELPEDLRQHPMVEPTE
jgi:hypothetical protein